MRVRRHAGQPDFARRHRLRHHHRFDRHRDREHPSPPGAAWRREGSCTGVSCARRRKSAVRSSSSTLIFVIAFLPLFTMRGVEGAIFSPMSHTYAYALGTAILLAVTLTPVLASFAFERGLHQHSNPIWEAISRFYHWFFVHVLSWPRLWLTVVTDRRDGRVSSIFPRLGGEFLPKLEEGNVWATATMPLTISLDHAARLSTACAAFSCRFPKSRPWSRNSVVPTTAPRPPDSSTSSSRSTSSRNRNGLPRLTKAALVKQMNAKLVREMPGVSFDYSQNIEANVDEALSGVKGSNSVKVFGPDLEVDERVANQLVEVMGKVPGIADLGVYRSLGQPNLVIKPDRAACARYGLNVCDVAGVVQAAIGGQAVTQVFEGDRRFDLVVRWKPQYRQSLDAIRNIRVTTPRRRRHPARAGRRYPHRGGCVIHLPRRSGALCAAAFRRARTRSAERSRRRQAGGRARGQAARGCASGVGRRIRRIAGGQSPPDDRGAVRICC